MFAALNTPRLRSPLRLYVGRWPLQGPVFYTSPIATRAACHTASFSPDEQYLVSGSNLGKAFVWNVSTRKVVKELGSHRDRVLAMWHPTHAMLASAAHDLVFWLPSSGDDDEEM